MQSPMKEEGSTLDHEPSRESESTHSAWGGSTIWTELRLAAQSDCPGAAKALENLCQRYWQPVYVYIRGHGHQNCEAEDLTQGFFAHLLSHGGLTGLDEAKGRFRSYLLVCLKNFLANEWDKSHTIKRGNGQILVSLDEVSAEEAYCTAAPGLTPDVLYDRRWALAVLKQALARLEAEEAQAGRAAHFARLHVFLTADGADDNYQAAGAALGLTSKAVGMAVHRLRQRFANTLRAEIAATVQPGQVEEELRCLMAALSQT